MTIQDLYDRFLITKNLQTHQLRTAALGQVIVEDWIGPQINIQDVVFTLLIHDMGNLVKFNLDTPDSKKWMAGEKESLDFWKKIQKKYQQKYGKRADQANVKIAREINCPNKIIDFLEHHEWQDLPAAIETKQWEHQIVFYGDVRIRPQGLTSLADRILDLKNRYQDRDPNWHKPEYYQELVNISQTLEASLDQQTQQALSQIPVEKIEQKAEQLRSFPLPEFVNLPTENIF